ncbi:MAG: hypothetical protein M1834_005084 [Cirrosporium novae-zelandiae]|nr:MAG: hypothetical protein M1834_005084 [Cirrosporium novae-zelandiae]
MELSFPVELPPTLPDGRNAAANSSSISCKACGKHFNTVIARDRHCLRCRKQPRIRKKACISCSHAKTRCDHGEPFCNRCTLKGLECTYAHQEKTSRHGRAQPGASERDSMQLEATSTEPVASDMNAVVVGQNMRETPPIDFLSELLVDYNYDYSSTQNLFSPSPFSGSLSPLLSG